MVGRALSVWLVLIGVETIHGVLRTIWLVPRVGDFASRQIGVFIGSGLILGVSWLFVPWTGARTRRSLLGVGFLWTVLTLGFEFSLGYWVLGLPWERMTSDYDLPRGGLMPIGLVVLVLSPLIAVRLRGLACLLAMCVLASGSYAQTTSPIELMVIPGGSSACGARHSSILLLL